MKDSILNDNGFSLDKLGTFLKIIDAGSIAVAADRDPSTQSLYSKHKSSLESAFGEKLFELRNGKLKPTSFGNEVAALAKAFEGALFDLRNRQRNSERPITIGAGDSVFHWLLLPVTNRLQAEFQGTAFRYQNLTTRQIIEAVGQGSIEIGIAREGELPANVIATRMSSFRFGLFYQPEAFPEPEIKSILGAQKLIGLSGNGSYASATRKLLSNLQLGSEPMSYFDSLPMIENALISMKTCAILPVEAKKRLRRNGFEMLTDPYFETFERHYFIFTNTASNALRSSIPRITNQLAKLIG